jgi:hypothetical protein
MIIGLIDGGLFILGWMLKFMGKNDKFEFLIKIWDKEIEIP